MNVTVLWSGGYDSTALIFHHLEQGDDVSLLSVKLENNPDQSRAESLARRWILELVKEEFGRTLRHTEVDWPMVSPEKFSLTQPPIWISAAAYNAHGKISAGWVKGDDVWHHKADVQALLGSLNKFRSEPIELVTPFEWLTKQELLVYYKRRPLVFQLLSTSQAGTPWSVGPDHDTKCVEMRRLAEDLRKCIPTGPGSLSFKPDRSEVVERKAVCVDDAAGTVR